MHGGWTAQAEDRKVGSTHWKQPQQEAGIIGQGELERGVGMLSDKRREGQPVGDLWVWATQGEGLGWDVSERGGMDSG